MSRSFGLSPEIIAYLTAANPTEHPVQAKCREETAALGWVSRMQISPEQGALMQLLVRLMGAKRTIEIGVFTGYSALTVGLVLKELHGADAHILACDIAKDWTAKGQGYWDEAGIGEIVDLRIAPATETLDAALAAGQAGSYDMAFIDADKTGYAAYYERCLQLLRPGGLMLFDNVLWSGAVADPGATDADTIALRALAQQVRSDPRVHAAMTAVGDGLLLAIKK